MPQNIPRPWLARRTSPALAALVVFGAPAFAEPSPSDRAAVPVPAAVVQPVAVPAPAPPAAPAGGHQVIEIRGGSDAVVTLGQGKTVTLRFLRVVQDGRCPRATPNCARPPAPLVEIEAVTAGKPNVTYRMSPAAHVAAPTVPIQGRFFAFADLSGPVRELTSGPRPQSIEGFVLRLTLSP